jgi:hypothetical protein
MLKAVLSDLARNLRAGLRLALLLRVSVLDFRIGVRDLVILLLFSAAFDVGIDFVRFGPDGDFSWLGVSGETYAAGAVLLVSALLSLAFGQRSLVLALPTLIFASYPPIQALNLIPELAQRWLPGGDFLSGWQDAVLLVWTVAVFVRAVAVALRPARPWRWPRSILGALALLAPLWFGSMFAPDTPWWRPGIAANEADADYPNPASEPVMEAQRTLLDEALAGLEEARSGVTDLYFIGFAASASDALRSDILAAVQVMDERWATDGRSLALVNHRASVLEHPMATVSNLHEVLAELQQVLDPNEDVVMLYLVGEGAPGGNIGVALAPFELVPLTPMGVRRMLDDAGIRWRIVVVSACHSGAWLEALAGDTTLVMTATDAQTAGEGCALGADGTVFGKALFGGGMTEAESLDGAFAIARKLVAERGGRTADDAAGAPQMVVGPAMAGKLKELERGRAARRASRSV